MTQQTEVVSFVIKVDDTVAKAHAAAGALNELTDALDALARSFAGLAEFGPLGTVSRKDAKKFVRGLIAASVHVQAAQANASERSAGAMRAFQVLAAELMPLSDHVNAQAARSA